MQPHDLSALSAHIRSVRDDVLAAKGIAELRVAFERYAIEPQPAAGVEVRKVDAPNGYWLVPPSAQANRRDTYFHGGSQLTGSFTMYAGMVSRIALASRCQIFFPLLPLAPEHPFPAAHDAALTAVRHVIAAGPSLIVLIGDSAGGSLAIATAMRLRDAGEITGVAGIVAHGPSTDLTGASDSLDTCQATDDTWVRRELLLQLPSMLGPTARAEDWLLSPLFGNFTGLPPILFQASDHEVLRDDSHRAAAKARSQGVDVTIQTWPHMPHVWPLAAPRHSASIDAVTKIGAFVDRMLPP